LCTAGSYYPFRYAATRFVCLRDATISLDTRSRFASLVTDMTEQTFDQLTEIAEILAAGLTRLEARKSSQNSSESGESSLHFSPDQSGDVPPSSAEASHD